MKRVLVVVMLFSCSLVVVAAQQQSDALVLEFTAALEQAKVEDKPVLVNVFTSDPESSSRPLPELWCIAEGQAPRSVCYTQQISDDIIKEARNLTSLSDPAVARCIQEDFVACEIDGSQERGFMQYYHVLGYPTLLFLSPQGEEIVRLQGAVKPEQILATASELLTNYCSIPEPLIVWEDPAIAFERAEYENKPVFLVTGDVDFLRKITKVLSEVHPEAIKALREDFVCVHLFGYDRDGLPSTCQDPDSGATFVLDHQPWIVRVDGMEMPEQCFEHLLYNIYIPLDGIPEERFDHYVNDVRDFPIQRGAHVLGRRILLGTGVEELTIKDKFGERTVYFLNGQQAVLSAIGRGSCCVYVLDSQGEPLINTSSFESEGFDWRLPEFHETIIMAGLRLWYGEDGFGIKDFGTALREVERTDRILLCVHARGATAFEMHTLFDELRGTIEQYSYVPALLNSLSWRRIDVPGLGVMPEWRVWMELECRNEKLRTSGLPCYCILAPNGVLIGDHIAGYRDIGHWIHDLQIGGLGPNYEREYEAAQQWEGDWQRLQLAVAENDWDTIDQMRKEGKLLCVWPNYWEGPFTLHLRGAPGGGPYIYGSGEGSGGIVLPPEIGRRFRDEQLMTPEEIQRMIERAGPPPKGGQRSTNSYGQEIIDVEVEP